MIVKIRILSSSSTTEFWIWSIRSVRSLARWFFAKNNNWTLNFINMTFDTEKSNTFSEFLKIIDSYFKTLNIISNNFVTKKTKFRIAKMFVDSNYKSRLSKKKTTNDFFFFLLFFFSSSNTFFFISFLCKAIILWYVIFFYKF